MKIPPNSASTTIIDTMVIASITLSSGMVRLKTVTVFLPLARVIRNRNSTMSVTVLTPPAVEPEEPPMSMRKMETPLPASVRAA